MIIDQTMTYFFACVQSWNTCSKPKTRFMVNQFCQLTHPLLQKIRNYLAGVTPGIWEEACLKLTEMVWFLSRSSLFVSLLKNSNNLTNSTVLGTTFDFCLVWRLFSSQGLYQMWQCDLAIIPCVLVLLFQIGNSSVRLCRTCTWIRAPLVQHADLSV